MVRRETKAAVVISLTSDDEDQRPTKRARTVKHRCRRIDWTEANGAANRASFVYIIKNDAGAVYTGSSRDPRTRLRDHNSGGTRSTRNGRPWRLAVVIGPFQSRTAATRFESLVKRGGAGVSLKVVAANRALQESPLGKDVSISLFSPPQPRALL